MLRQQSTESGLTINGARAIRQELALGGQIQRADVVALVEEYLALVETVPRLRGVLALTELDRLLASSDAYHEGWLDGVRGAASVLAPDDDQAVQAVEQSGLEANTYLVRYEMARAERDPGSDTEVPL